MAHGGWRAWLAVCVLALATGAAAAWAFDTLVEPSVRTATARDSDRQEGREELLAVDRDGTILVAFYRGVDESITFERAPAGQIPGLAVIAQDGTRSVLLTPLDDPRLLDVRVSGSLLNGEVAFAVGAKVEQDGEVVPAGLWTGTTDAVQQSPDPVVDGIPAAVEHWSLWIADGGLLAVAATGFLEQHLGVIDPATGVMTTFGEGMYLPGFADQCGTPGRDFIIPVLPEGAEGMQPIAVAVEEGRIVSADMLPGLPGLSLLPVSGCGDAVSGSDYGEQIGVWQSGGELVTTTDRELRTSDVLLTPDVAVGILTPVDSEDLRATVRIWDRATGDQLAQFPTCDRIIVTGAEWLGYGEVRGDDCVRVARRLDDLVG